MNTTTDADKQFHRHRLRMIRAEVELVKLADRERHWARPYTWPGEQFGPDPVDTPGRLARLQALTVESQDALALLTAPDA
jgi:hypothetical protein